MIKKSFFVQLGASYANLIFLLISGLFFVPLYLKYIGINIYGSWLASGNLLNILGVVEGGVSIVLSQKLAASFFHDEKNDFVKTAASGLVISVLTATIFLIITLTLSDFISFGIETDKKSLINLKTAFILAGIGSFLGIFNSVILAIIRSWHKYEFSAFVSLIGTIFGLFSIYLSLVIFNLNIVSLGIGALVRSFIIFFGNIFFLILKWNLYSEISLQFDLNNFKYLLNKTLPVFGSTLIGLILNNSKEILVAVLLNPSAVTLLSVTSRLYSFISAILYPISSSLFTAFSSFSSNSEKFLFWKSRVISGYNLIACFFYVFAISLNESFIEFWVGDKLYGGIILSTILGFSSWVSSKGNLSIIILNSQSQFIPTSKISFLDILLRTFLIFIIYIFKIDFKIYYLPLIELFSICIGYLLLEFNLSKNTSKNAIKNIFSKAAVNFGLNLFLITCCLLLNSIYFSFIGSISSINKLIMSFSVTTIIYSIYIFSSKYRYHTHKEIFRLINLKIR